MGLQHDFKRTSSTLEIVHNWYEPYHKFGLIFFLVWDLLCIAFYSHLFFALSNKEATFFQNIFTVLSFFMLILVPTYWMILFFVNRTRVQMSRTEFIVQSGPLPSLRKDHSFLIKRVWYIQVEKHCINKNFENTWQAKADETCNVNAILNNGESISILENIQNPAEAQIVRSNINSWLLETKRRDLHQKGMRDFSLEHGRGSNGVLNLSRRDNET